MPAFVDLAGQTYGTLLVKEFIHGNRHKSGKWVCECQKCGNCVEVTTAWLHKNVELKRDGCKHAKPVDIGNVFGNLTVIFKSTDYIKPKSGAHETRWHCQCVCGRERDILESNLKAYKSLSCGKCNNRVSIPEKMIYYYLSKVFDNIQENYRPDFLNGLEIDIYLPSLKVGIEYDGERWHRGLDKDLNKSLICKENGIILIRIREPKCPTSTAFEYQIITPKPTTNGTHMTEPIKRLIALLNNKYVMNIKLDVDCLRDNADICRTIVSSVGFNSLAVKFPDIAKEWDYEKNYPLTPDNVSAHAGRAVYWICPICGKSYHSVIASRTGKDKCNCPDCRYKKAYKKVMCVETGQIYNSVKDAAKSVNKKPCSITSCCKDKNNTSTVGGYHWKYAD